MQEKMETYDALHKIDANENYMSDTDELYSDYEYNIKDEEKSLAFKMKNNNYKKISHSEKIKLLPKHVSEQRIERELLKYELKHYIPTKEKHNLKSFLRETMSLLKRYQCKAGGYYIEDYEWTVYENDFKNREVSSNDIYLENSIDKFDAKDYDTVLFMKRIIRILDSLSDDIDVTYEMEESKEDDLSWVYIIVEFKNGINKSKSNNSSLIGV